MNKNYWIIIYPILAVIIIIGSVTILEHYSTPHEHEDPPHEIFGVNETTGEMQIIGYGTEDNYKPIKNDEFLYNDRKDRLTQYTYNVSTFIKELEYYIKSYNETLYSRIPALLNKTEENMSILKNESSAYTDWYIAYYTETNRQNMITTYQAMYYENKHIEYRNQLNEIKQKYNWWKE